MARRYNRIPASTTEDAAVNLMPLIDVIFVVLVMFIVIAPMIDVDQVNLAEGTTLVKESELNSNIAVYVRGDNSLWVNKRQVSLNELQTLLFRTYQQNPQSSFQVFHDRNATFGTYQEIRSIGQKAGFEHMDVILKPNG